jgi:hypothetical protein
MISALLQGPKAPPPAEARATAVASMPAEVFRIVGVSFDGRQDLLDAISKGVHCIHTLQSQRLELTCATHKSISGITS